MTRYHYKVELTRRVRTPEYGKAATTTQIASRIFRFGEGEALKTGKAAYKVACDYARGWVPKCSAVSIWRLSEGGNGRGDYLLDSGEVLPDRWAA